MPMMELFEKLAQQEQGITSMRILAPIIRGCPLRVNISGVIVELKIVEPKGFKNGWGIFAPINFKTAKLVSNPSRRDQMEYLRLFPRLSMVLTKAGEEWVGTQANSGDSRFRITGRVPIFMVEDAYPFDVIDVRFDGSNFWYDGPSNRGSRTSSYLREEWRQETPPENLAFSGLTPEEKEAYNFAFADLLESRKDLNEERIKLSLARAGADFKGYIERDTTFTVEYTVDGQNHKTVVDKSDLRVRSAGICLSGGDRSFDLQSLVYVIREGVEHDLIVRVGLRE